MPNRRRAINSTNAHTTRLFVRFLHCTGSVMFGVYFQLCCRWSVEAWSKWQISCRRHSQMHCLQYRPKGNCISVWFWHMYMFTGSIHLTYLIPGTGGVYILIDQLPQWSPWKHGVVATRMFPFLKMFMSFWCENGGYKADFLGSVIFPFF